MFTIIQRGRKLGSILTHTGHDQSGKWGHFQPKIINHKIRKLISVCQFHGCVISCNKQWMTVVNKGCCINLHTTNVFHKFQYIQIQFPPIIVTWAIPRKNHPINSFATPLPTLMAIHCSKSVSCSIAIWSTYFIGQLDPDKVLWLVFAVVCVHVHHAPHAGYCHNIDC